MFDQVMTEKLLLFIPCTLSLDHPKLRLHFSNRLRSLLEFKDSLMKNGTHNPLNMSLACAATTAALVFLNLIQSSSFRLTASRNFPFMSEMWPPPFSFFPIRGRSQTKRKTFEMNRLSYDQISFFVSLSFLRCYSIAAQALQHSAERQNAGCILSLLVQDILLMPKSVQLKYSTAAGHH